MNDLSKDQLFTFLDYVAEKGLMKRATAGALRSACTAVLDVIEDGEAKDLSKLDIDSALRRYENLKGFNVSPGTLKTYGRRVKYAIGEFEKYSADRAGWKPSGGQRTTGATKTSSKKTSVRKSQRIEKDDDPAAPREIMDASDIVHRFPLRHDVVITIQGIPFDVRKSEMGRLNGFLSNLVSVSEELEQQQLMLGSPPNGQQEGA